jgi:hypothetical protein
MSEDLKQAKEASLAMGVALRAAKRSLGEESFTEAMLALVTIDCALNRSARLFNDQSALRFFAVITGPDGKSLAANDDTLKS